MAPLRKEPLLLIVAVSLVDIAKLLPPVGGLTLTLTLRVDESIARANMSRLRQAEGQAAHQGRNQDF